MLLSVIPAKAGIQAFQTFMDPRWSLPSKVVIGGGDDKNKLLL